MPRSRAPMVSTRLRWSAEEARDALAAQRASGFSLREFSRRERLDPQRLERWRRNFAEHESEPTSFVEVSPTAAAAAVVEVVLCTGRVLRVAESIDAAALLRLVEALERTC